MNRGSGFYNYAYELNGSGNQAAEFARAISMLTGTDNIRSLTLISLHDILSARELFSPSKKWCPLCFEEWKKASHIIYEPLLWFFKSVNRCNIHNISLQTRCPNCEKPVPVLSRTSRNGFCSFCGCWLGPNGIKESNVIDADQIAWEYHVTSNIGSLLKNNNGFEDLYTYENLLASIKMIVAMCGGINAFSRNFDIPKSTIISWLEDGYKPSLKYLLNICYNLSIDITELFGQHLKSNICSHNNAPQSKKGRKVNIVNWVSVNEKLINVIADYKNDSPSVREVARNLGCNERSLYRHFPDLCKMISENHRLLVNSLKRNRLEENKKVISEATISIFNDGFYPTKRKVEDYTAHKISLQSKDNYVAWKETLRELDLR